MEKHEAVDYFKAKLIEASVPLSVGILMLAATWHIVVAVKAEILTLAQEAATIAVNNALTKVSPAIEWQSVKVLKPVVKIGDVLELEYTALIKRQCPADVRAFLINDDSDIAAYRFPDQAGGYRLSNTQPQTWRVKISVSDPPIGSGFPPLAAGNYRYRATAIRYCDRIELDANIPDALFKLVR